MFREGGGDNHEAASQSKQLSEHWPPVRWRNTHKSARLFRSTSSLFSIPPFYYPDEVVYFYSDIIDFSFAGWFIHSFIYLTAPPSFCSDARPFSWYSALLSQNESLSFMMLASTAPPRNTICFRLGGSSIRILNFLGLGWSTKQRNKQTRNVVYWGATGLQSCKYKLNLEKVSTYTHT